MDKFERKVMEYIERRSLIGRGDRILVACSGGVDSVGLLLFLAKQRHFLDIELVAVHVDHMLRGEESKEDGVYVKELCTRFEIPFYGGQVPVPELIGKEGGNVQDVCRKGRYGYFAKVMAEGGYTKLAVAHHAEDQLETVIMQLSKGSVPIGMRDARAVQGGMLIRPFMTVDKLEIRSYIEKFGVEHREDPSNASDKYTRNYLRHHAVPPILKTNHMAAANSVRMTESLQEDDALLSDLANEAFSRLLSLTAECLPSFEIKHFASMHPALQKRMIPLLLNYLYRGEEIPVEYSGALVEQLLRQLQTDAGNAELHLPGGYLCIREYGVVRFEKSVKEPEPDPPKILLKGVWTRWGKQCFYWNAVSAAGLPSTDEYDERMYFTLPVTDFPLFVRARKDGDRIWLKGMPKPKRLSRLFIDEKVAAQKRDRLPIIVTADDEVCAVPGVRYGKLFSRQANGEEYVFMVKPVGKYYGPDEELAGT
ncbi:tRNA lysidine(34) synthetase TilS [Sporosarcina sp. Te-1]|uniref:tRNA lysidine(34) synthetase TilS n=1 Tax=Sporosarcina sp. Te-1 TaxID=2818390 RepID=UPI001A9FFD08|nr:tRNA lysidine(34) synthetase TilS [Sporosarcina sp. Te-1]QTD40264.1 tRNA lysidine(34) synthetase TilS [Sporosarcina sp. Te-1]